MSWNTQVKKREGRPEVVCSAVTVAVKAEDASSRQEPATASKRKRQSNEDEEDEAFFIGKRPKKERDYHLREMEEQLQSALRYAKDGDRNLMDYVLEKSMVHAKEAGILPEYTQRERQIRNLLGNEQDFHSRKMDKDLGAALRYAKEGNRNLMDFSLEEAKGHARRANVLPEYTQRERQIRNLLANEKDFHLLKMEEDLRAALRHAKNGNRSLMDYVLEEGRGHATEANALPQYIKREREIQSLLASEKNFHLREMEKKLGAALRYAVDGNRISMEFQLEEATRHAMQGSYHRIDSRISKICSIFYGVKPEQNPTSTAFTQNNRTTTLSCRPGQVSPGDRNNKVTVTSSKDNEAIIEKEMDAQQIIANRLKVAESKGEVIDFS